MKHVVDHFAQKKVKLFELIVQKWKILRELVMVLKIPFNATVSLQNPSITLSDVFGIWHKMKLHLEACVSKSKFKTNFAKHLVDALNRRYNAIFDNPEMECALFLDPRYRTVVLNNIAAERAKLTLIDLWKRIKCLKENNSTVQNSNCSSDFNFSFDEQAALNKLVGPNATCH